MGARPRPASPGPPGGAGTAAGLVLLVLALAAGGCPSDGGGDGGPVWDPAVTVPTELLGAPRGTEIVRGTIHLHSVISHDACYGEPNDSEQGGTSFNEPCLADLRAAICANRQDFVFLSEHFSSLVERDFETLFLVREDDELIRDGDRILAKRIHCADGSTSLWMTGLENDVSPAGLKAHVADTPAEREVEYHRTDPAYIEQLHRLGAFTFVPHPEERTLAFYRSTPVDVTEIYNLHANIDPRSRAEFLGLPALDFVGPVLTFLPGLSDDPPHPDLAILAFFAESPAVATWDTLTAEGRRLFGALGCDSHQNSIPLRLADGDTADSYKRMLHWFSQHLQIPDGTRGDPRVVKDTIRAGRYSMAFEFLGVPDGFDFFARAGGERVVMGGTAPRERTPQLVVEAPRVFGLDPAVRRPEIVVRILRAEPGGAVEVARGSGRLVFETAQPGAYRAEARIVPHHLAGHLGELADAYVRETAWVYSNPIWVE